MDDDITQSLWNWDDVTCNTPLLTSRARSEPWEDAYTGPTPDESDESNEEQAKTQQTLLSVPSIEVRDPPRVWQTTDAENSPSLSDRERHYSLTCKEILKATRVLLRPSRARISDSRIATSTTTLGSPTSVAQRSQPTALRRLKARSVPTKVVKLRRTILAAALKKSLPLISLNHLVEIPWLLFWLQGQWAIDEASARPTTRKITCPLQLSLSRNPERRRKKIRLPTASARG